MTTPTKLAYLTLIACLCFGCVLRPSERAPLQGGETITYKTYLSASPATAVITFASSGSGFVITSNGIAFPPEEVSGDLRHGRSRLKVFNLAILWLAPSERRIGTKNHLGEVTERTTSDGREVYVLSERNGAMLRYFDAQTGFLVKAKRPDSIIGTTDLVSSTIPGL